MRAITRSPLAVRRSQRLDHRVCRLTTRASALVLHRRRLALRREGGGDRRRRGTAGERDRHGAEQAARRTARDSQRQDIAGELGGKALELDDSHGGGSRSSSLASTRHLDTETLVG
jgi:hypothetical protein